jgi:FkbM family methyltransferase
LLSRLIDKFFVKRPHVRRIITKCIYGEEDVYIELCGTRLLINSLRENGYLRAFRNTERNSFLSDELNTLITLSAICDRMDCFVDIGANIGIYSAIMARRRLFSTQFRMIAFEPHPDTFIRLRQNVSSLGVEIQNIALSDVDGELEFVDGAVSHVFTALQFANSYNIRSEIITVETKRLDHFEWNSNSVFLKIDAEGQELKILQGAQGMFDRGIVSGVYLDGYEDRRCITYLGGIGFEIYDLKTMKISHEPEFNVLALRKPGEAVRARR